MKRGHIAVLALVLALGSGCGGSDGGGAAEKSSPAPSSGKENTVLPSPPPQSEATKMFRDCMRKEGVELPSPNPTSTPDKRDTQKLMAAMRKCMTAVTAPPTAG